MTEPYRMHGSRALARTATRAVLAAAALALGGCGLAETTTAAATGAASEVQQAKDAQRTEQQVVQKVDAAQAQAKAQLDTAGASADQ
jgi:hypothetical protein